MKQQRKEKLNQICFSRSDIRFTYGDQIKIAQIRLDGGR